MRPTNCLSNRPSLRHALAALLVAITIVPAALRAEDAAPSAAVADPALAKPRWVDVTNDLANDSWGPGGVTLVAVVPGTERVIAGISGKWLWTSANGGASWTALGAVGNAKNRPSSIVFAEPDTFWATSGAGAPGAFATSDGGKTFKPVPNVEAADSISVDVTDPKHRTVQTMMIGPHEKEHDVEISSNGGAFFSKAAKFPNTTGYTGQVLALDDKTWLACAAGFDARARRRRRSASGGPRTRARAGTRSTTAAPPLRPSSPPLAPSIGPAAGPATAGTATAGSATRPNACFAAATAARPGRSWTRR